MMDNHSPPANHMNDILSSMYRKNTPSKDKEAGTEELIDISSDESDEEENSSKKAQPKQANVGKTGASAGAGDACSPDGRRRRGSVTQVIPEITIKRRRMNSTESQEAKGPSEVPSSKVPVALIHQSQFKNSKKKKHLLTRKSNLTFRNIGGMDKIIKELIELVFHFKHPELYHVIGVTPPRGILLHGPPGCGKTMLARAIAGQLNIPLLEIAATELVAGLSGESEERIREIFNQAALTAPCVLFIDEIDAISSNRGNAQKEMERRMVTQLISSLDSLSKLQRNQQVLVIGATNRPDNLDPALRRVGRFDHEIALGIPDRDQRQEILIVICEKMLMEKPFDYQTIAALTPGFVGADLFALATRAASLTMKRLFSKIYRDRMTKMSKNVPIVDLIDDSVGDEEKHKDATNPEKPPSNGIVKESTETISGEASSDEVATKEGPSTDETPKETSGEKNENTEKSNSEVTSTGTPDKDTNKPEDKTENMEVNQSETVKAPSETTSTVEASIDLDDIPDQPVKCRKKHDSSLFEMLNWLDPTTEPLEVSHLKDVCVTFNDFKDAIKLVTPSAKREGFVTVPDVTWDDIGSLQDVREELQLTVLAPVKHPDKMKSLGLTAPSGILLCGPPGCGKTLLAKAIANEAGINFLSVKGPELMNMYVGESERAVRSCFQRARNSAPCVIFFDEFDSLCPKRSDSADRGSGTRVVNQLLTEMDGIEERKGVFVMAATNRPDIIDPAILRPGRLDTVLYVGLPSEKDREEILEAVTKKRTQPRLADDVSLAMIAKETDGFTGADLAGLIRQASLLALKSAIGETDQNENEIEVSKQNVFDALSQSKPSVSLEEQKVYEKLRLKYAAPRSKDAK